MIFEKRNILFQLRAFIYQIFYVMKYLPDSNVTLAIILRFSFKVVFELVLGMYTFLRHIKKNIFLECSLFFTWCQFMLELMKKSLNIAGRYHS